MKTSLVSRAPWRGVAAGLSLALVSSPLPLSAAFEARQVSQGADYRIYQYDDPDPQGDNRMWQLWLPETGRPLRWVLVNGNPGTGDGTGAVLVKAAQEWARRLDGALMASAGVSGGSTYNNHGAMFVEAINAWAALGHHPELVNLPFITCGNSSAGANAYGLAMRYPERTIGFTSNVMASVNPATPPAAGRQVPGIMVLGEVDNLVPNSIGATATLLQSQRPQGALWGRMVIQGMGHEHRRVFRLFYPFWEKCLEERLPEEWDPLSGPPQLRPMAEDTGWLVSTADSLAGRGPISPAAELSGDKAGTNWYADAGLARLAASFAAYDQYGDFSIDGVHSYPGFDNVPPAELAQSHDMTTFRPGVTLTLRYSPGERTWQKVRFYDQHGNLLGERQPPEEPMQTAVTSTGRMAQSFCAVVTDGDGIDRPVLGQGVLVLPGRPQWFPKKKFGWYYEGYAPWYYHLDLGWIYPASEDSYYRSGGFFYYDAGRGAWYWTKPGFLPFSCRLPEGTWEQLSITVAP